MSKLDIPQVLPRDTFGQDLVRVGQALLTPCAEITLSVEEKNALGHLLITAGIYAKALNATAKAAMDELAAEAGLPRDGMIRIPVIGTVS